MYQVKTKDELIKIIDGKIISLDTIDTSLITNMDNLFYGIKEINGSISNWDVSNVKNMYGMFYNSFINPDISKWDTSKVKNMSMMFCRSLFNGDISKWDTSSVENMSAMFGKSIFTGDISSWDVSKVETMSMMFSKSQFNGNISSWNVSNVKDMESMFANSLFDQNIGAWNLDNKNIDNIFQNASFSDICKYEKNREDYLKLIELEKEKNIKDDILNLNNSLNQDIELNTIEMEF